MRTKGVKYRMEDRITGKRLNRNFDEFYTKLNFNGNKNSNMTNEMRVLLLECGLLT